MKTQPAAVTGDGGNAQVVNQDEAEILGRVVTDVAITAAPGGMEDDSFVGSQFRHQGIAGS